MGSLLTSLTKATAGLSDLQHDSNYLNKMACYGTDEENLVAFLGGFNQICLSCIFVNIGFSVAFEDSGAATGVDEDYDFDLDTALEKGSRHYSMMAGLAFLGLAATVYVMLARLFAEARRKANLSLTCGYSK